MWLQPFDPPNCPVFQEYLEATRELPIGTDRLLWRRDALRELDIQLEAINRQYRDRIFDTCYKSIDQYAALANDQTHTAHGLVRITATTPPTE